MVVESRGGETRRWWDSRHPGSWKLNTDWEEKGRLRVGIQVDDRAQRVVVRRAGRHLGVAEEARYWVEDWVGGWVEYFLLRHLVHLGDVGSMADSSFPLRWKRSVRPVHRVERYRRH